MKIEDLIHQSGDWLKGEGPDSQIVVSSRARLARNLACYHFASRISLEDKAEVVRSVLNSIKDIPEGLALTYFDLEAMNELDRQLMVERHLISREQARAEGPRGVAINTDESISLMVNEEDHIRLQTLLGGLRIHECFDLASRIDDEISEKEDYAFDQDYGYLTACPTNLGTGLRVSVMLHLPGLVMTGGIEKAFRAVHDLKLAVRGLYGEGTEASGEFYQISNQITLGRSEEDIVNDLEAVIDGVVNYEKKARARLLDTETVKVEDRVWRAWGALTNARTMSSEEAMQHLSSARLGQYLQILPQVSCHRMNRLFMFIQPAHLQRMEGRNLPPKERDIIRARFIRTELEEATA